MKRNWLRTIIGGLSFTTSLFIFQACYGTPQDMGFDVFVEGKVTARNSGLPIQGIKVGVAENMQYTITDADGYFSFYTEKQTELRLQFQDVDSTKNLLFQSKDTLFSHPDDEIFVNMSLEEQ